MKKIVAIVLSMILCLTLAVGAFAVGSNQGGVVATTDVSTMQIVTAVSADTTTIVPVVDDVVLDSATVVSFAAAADGTVTTADGEVVAVDTTVPVSVAVKQLESGEEVFSMAVTSTSGDPLYMIVRPTTAASAISASANAAYSVVQLGAHADNSGYTYANLAAGASYTVAFSTEDVGYWRYVNGNLAYTDENGVVYYSSGADANGWYFSDNEADATAVELYAPAEEESPKTGTVVALALALTACAAGGVSVVANKKSK